MQLEDTLLALFGASGLVTIIANALVNSSNPQYAAVGGALVAIGVLFKAFLKPTTPAPTTGPAP